MSLINKATMDPDRASWVQLFIHFAFLAGSLAAHVPIERLLLKRSALGIIDLVLYNLIG